MGEEGSEVDRLTSYKSVPTAVPTSIPAPLTPLLFFRRYRGMGLDGARRKNATRETTSTLKTWLNEHRKNPYPTKAEKIMLAIMSKMTLTQVSHAATIRFLSLSNHVCVRDRCRRGSLTRAVA